MASAPCECAALSPATSRSAQQMPRAPRRILRQVVERGSSGRPSVPTGRRLPTRWQLATRQRSAVVGSGVRSSLDRQEDGMAGAQRARRRHTPLRTWESEAVVDQARDEVDIELYWRSPLPSVMVRGAGPSAGEQHFGVGRLNLTIIQCNSCTGVRRRANVKSRHSFESARGCCPAGLLLCSANADAALSRSRDVCPENTIEIA